MFVGDFDRTLVIFFGDHGPRFGPFRSTLAGRVAERYPMQLVVFPKWFRENYPKLFNQFQVSNSQLDALTLAYHGELALASAYCGGMALALTYCGELALGSTCYGELASLYVMDAKSFSMIYRG